MTEPMAFKATYSDWKLIKTRGVVQVVMEVPLAEADAAYDVLGGMPNPSNETWFGIAPIKPQAGNTVVLYDKRKWADMQPAQQAGIRCSDAVFIAFLKEQRKDDWAEAPDPADCVRLICAVHSRSELQSGKPRVIWHQLDTQYQAWLAAERVGA